MGTLALLGAGPLAAGPDPAAPPNDISIAWASGFEGGNVPDGTASGTTIGTISGTDPNGDALTFSEVTDSTNSFTVSGTTLSLAKAAAYSEGSSRDITIRATDTGAHTYDETFTVAFLAPNAIGQYDTGTLVLSNGGKTATKISGSGAKGAKGKGSLSGKSQFEFAISAMASTMAVGLATSAVPTSSFPDGSAGLSVLFRSDGTIWKNGTQVASGYPTFGAGDTVMGAFDAATGKVWFGKNGTWQGSPAAGTGNATTADSGVYYPAVYLYSVNDAVTINTAASELTTALQSGFSPAYSTTPPTSYANAGGQGNRTATITVTDTQSLGGGGASALVNGSKTSDGTNSAWFLGNGNDIVFDFGSGATKYIDEATWYQSDTSTHGWWAWEASNDGSTFVRASGAFLLGGSTAFAKSLAPAGGYRYYGLKQISGLAGGAPYLQEVEFKIGDASSAAPSDLSAVPNYSNPGGSGDRTASITITSNVTFGGAAVSTIINGVPGEPSPSGSNACFFQSAVSNASIVFDFGSQKLVTELNWIQSAAASHGTWKIQGSNTSNTGPWTDIGSSFTLGAAEVTVADISSNATKYRYYNLQQVSGTTNTTPWLFEAEFKIAA